MNVYITRLNGMMTVSTPQYVQRITAEVAYQLGCRELGIYYYNADVENTEHMHVRVDGIIAGIQAGDIVICQFPTWNGIKFERVLVEHIRAYHGHIVIFVHDLEALMLDSWKGKLQETIDLYNQAEVLIIPSYAMKEFLLENGIKKKMKFVIQELWDYPTDISFTYTPKLEKEIHFAGSPGKFVFPNQWNYSVLLKVYSDESCTGKNIQRIGWTNPSALLLELAKGGFGLVWYGNETWHQYMRYNNNTKLSTYLAAGIPVIVPRGISNQYLIEENHLGLVVDSLDEAVEKVDSMTEQEYQEYLYHVGNFAYLVRGGYFTKKIIPEAVQAVCRERIERSYISLHTCYKRGGDNAFIYVVLNRSYDDNLALSWNFKGEADGFLIYDSSKVLVADTENIHQHYLLIENYDNMSEFIVQAYVNTLKGRFVIAESDPVHMQVKMNTIPKVSLVMPAYNAESYIARSIDTAIAQSFSDLEIIIVNDGSTDGTQMVIDWYKERYPQIKTVYQHNGGQAAARNTGVKHAVGNYICLMDNDDMIKPDMVEKLYHSIIKNDCDIAISSIYLITDKGYTELMHYALAEDVAIPVEEFFEHYIADFNPVLWNKLYKTSLVKMHPFAMATYEDDSWTPYVLSYADKVCYINEHLYEYDRTIRAATGINASWRKPIEEKFIDHKEIIDFFLKNGNPQRRELLKRLALRIVGTWMAAFSYPKYSELKEEIERYV